MHFWVIILAICAVVNNLYELSCCLLSVSLDLCSFIYKVLMTVH